MAQKFDAATTVVPYAGIELAANDFYRKAGLNPHSFTVSEAASAFRKLAEQNAKKNSLEKK